MILNLVIYAAVMLIMLLSFLCLYKNGKHKRFVFSLAVTSFTAVTLYFAYIIYILM